MESIIAIILFACIVVPMSVINPIGVIYDYSPAMRQRCMELGLILNTEKRFAQKDIIKDATNCICFN